MSKAFIAIDLGASSGRTMLGILDNNKLTIKEINRFWNGPKNNDGVLRWDFSSLLSNIKNGIKLAESEHPISSIAIDTWGVDFGLIDKDGALLEEPVHYRDDRTSGLFEEAFKLVSKKEIYQKTGIQFMELNTLYQCLALKLQNDKSYLESSNLIFSPDLLSYMLTGKIYAEKTIASTSQFYNPSTQSWDIDLLQRLGIRTDILPKLINSGSNVGYYEKIPVIAGAGHDTACAFAAAPIESSTKSAILSSGTWSLFGCELEKPLINDEALNEDFTNEVGINNSIRFLKNMNGLWIIQELKRIWNKNGYSYSFSDMVTVAERATPFKFFINPAHEMFFSPGDMENRIKNFCNQTEQDSPATHDEIVRTAYEGLAFLYADTFNSLKKITDIPFDNVHIVGGGSKNELLNQMTANSTGLPVVSGPIEATAIGNILIQMIALGKIDDIENGRLLVRRSFRNEINNYTPVNRNKWIEAKNTWDVYSKSI